MRRKTGYELKENKESTQFRFMSVSNEKSIEKIVDFKPLTANLWNLAFGDKKENDWEDNTISNNDDMRKVLQTIVNAIHLFLDFYPESDILIRPLDYQRKLLYNRTFQQKWSEIDKLFFVSAFVINDLHHIVEDYNPTKIYDYFVISRKNDNFDK
jgi:hypothetical protein